jgi:hypothetical protein
MSKVTLGALLACALALASPAPASPVSLRSPALTEAGPPAVDRHMGHAVQAEMPDAIGSEGLLTTCEGRCEIVSTEFAPRLVQYRTRPRARLRKPPNSSRLDPAVRSAMALHEVRRVAWTQSASAPRLVICV